MAWCENTSFFQLWDPIILNDVFVESFECFVFMLFVEELRTSLRLQLGQMLSLGFA